MRKENAPMEMMRDEWEGLKKDCPDIAIQGPPRHSPVRYYCKSKKEDCHYKGCAIMYWFRHLMKDLKRGDAQ